MYSRIRELRKAKGLSQQQLSAMTNIAQAQISKYEQGRIASPSFHSLHAIAEALGVHIEELSQQNINTGKLSAAQFATPDKVKPFGLRSVTGLSDLIPLLTMEKQTVYNFEGVVYKEMDDVTNAFIRRPVLAGEHETVYALRQPNDKMEPRIRRGEIVICVDDQRWQSGHEICLVVNCERLGSWCMVCNLIEQDDEKVVISFSDDPQKTYEYPRQQVRAIHRIFGTMYQEHI